MSFPGGGFGAKDNAVGGDPACSRHGVFAVMSVGLVACGDSSDDSGSSSPVAETMWLPKRRRRTRRKCGLGNGQKATDLRRLKLGAIITKQPGTDFTDIKRHGQGLLRLRERQRRHQRAPRAVPGRDPGADEPAAGRRRWPPSWSRTTRCSGIVGNTSLIDCAVNQKYYEKQKDST